ncbi:MAG: 3-keto-5-aminohexanoate cleavage protein [Acidimicrobiales bacterium]
MSEAPRAKSENGPVLIEAAINGVVRKSDNPHVPRSRDEIRADVREVIAAGASMVHPHQSDEGRGSTDADDYAATWQPLIDDEPALILYPTVGTSGSYEERYSHMGELAQRGLLRVGAIDAGSTNLGVVDLDGVPLPSDSVYANSYAYVAHMVAQCEQYRLAPTFAIFEPTFLHTVLAYYNANRLPSGAWLKFYFAGHGGYPGTGGANHRPAPFGLPPTEKALDAYLEIIGDCPIPWGVSAVGGDVVGCGIAELALRRGGHIHVGLEAYSGPRQPTNAELVDEVVTLARSLGRTPVHHRECADFLGFG